MKRTFEFVIRVEVDTSESATERKVISDIQYGFTYKGSGASILVEDLVDAKEVAK